MYSNWPGSLLIQLSIRSKNKLIEIDAVCSRILFKIEINEERIETKTQTGRKRELFVICNIKHMLIDASRPVEPPSKWISNS